MANKITGGAHVSGASSFQVQFRARPRNPQAEFTDDDPPPPGCGPIPPADEIEAEAVNLGTSLRPVWALEVSWDVADTRTLAWSCDR